MEKVRISHAMSKVRRQCARWLPRSSPAGGRLTVYGMDAHNPQVRVVSSVQDGRGKLAEKDFLCCELAYERSRLFLKVRLNIVLCGNGEEVGVRASLAAELIRMAPKLAKFVDGMELELDPET